MPARLNPAPDKALERLRIVRPGDDNFPTTPALRSLLRDRGMIEEPDPPPATIGHAIGVQSKIKRRFALASVIEYQFDATYRRLLRTAISKTRQNAD